MTRIHCAALIVTALLFSSPLAAQSEAPPEIAISPPDGTTYTTATAGGSVTIPLSIGLYDADGLNRSSLNITLQSGATTRTLSLTWSSTDGKHATVRGNVTTSHAGENVLTVRIADAYGETSIGSAIYVLVYQPPPPPPMLIVDTSVFHSEYRNTSQNASLVSYALATPTIFDTPGSVALTYSSEQSSPTGYFQVDVRSDPSIVATTKAFSLRIVERDAPNNPVTREYFWATHDGTNQRLAAHWDMSHRPTGAYKYTAVIRLHKTDGAVHERQIPFRVLIANDGTSVYGRGWSVAGVQQLHKSADGVLLNQGDGTLLWFANPGCAAGADCVYTTPVGDFTTLRYTAAGDRWTRTDPSGNATIEFSGPGIMTRVTDRFGRSTSYEWQKSQDGQNKDVLSRIIDPAGKQIVFAYWPAWYLRSITAAGRSFELWYNGVQVTDVIGPTRIRNIAYTADGLISSYTEQYQDWYQRTFAYTYDAFRGVRAMTAPAVTVNGASVAPQTTTQSLPSVTVPAATAGTSLTNLAPALPSAQAMVVVNDPGGHPTRVALDRFGAPLKVVDAIGTTVTIERNAAGLPVAESSPTSTASYFWDSAGRLIETRVNGVRTYYAAYQNGLLTNELKGNRQYWYTYGPRGELLRSWYDDYDDSVRNGTTYEYNSRYQLIRVTSPKGAQTEWAYDGNAFFNADYERVIRTDGSLIETRFVYKADTGLVETVRNHFGSEHQTYAYDTLGRVISVTGSDGLGTTSTYTGPHLTKVTDRGGKVYEFVYNALGWLETEKFPDAKSRSYKYDIDGLLISRTDRRLKTVTSAFDTLHRVTSVTADGATTTYSYPGVFTTIATNAEATITTRVTAGTGLLESYSIARGGRRYEIKPGYDATDAYLHEGIDISYYVNDALTKTDTIRYVPDYEPATANTSYALGVRNVSGFTSKAAVDAAGRPSWTFFANGITAQHDYASDGRLSSTYYYPSGLAGRLGVSYTYDSLSRLASRWSSTNDYSYVNYDVTGRLTSYISWANGIPSRSEAYTYDAAGNRTDRGAALEPLSNRYRTFDGFTMEYDAEGNITRMYNATTDQRLTWNSLGQLTGVTTNGVTVNYAYDPYGNRFRRTEGLQTGFFVYFNGDLLVETDGNGAAVRTYTYWPGIDRPLSVRVTSGTQNADYYYALEQPGHVTGVMDAAGSVVAAYRYTPWGEIESSTGTLDQPLRYMAREYDSTTRLYYVRNRWYDTSLARFISEDPIGLAGGMNTYAYVENDTVNRTDPSGLGPCPGPGCLPTVVVVCNQGYDPDCDGGPWSGWGDRLQAYEPTTNALGMRVGLFANIVVGTTAMASQLRPKPTPDRAHCYEGGPDPEEVCRGITPPRQSQPFRERLRDERRAAREACRAQPRPRSGWLEEFGHEAKWAVGGAVVGTVVGGAAGSLLGPAGTVVGSWGGRFAGLLVGGLIGAAVETTGNRIFERCGPGLL
jgi:RHS repeat-associated protein